MVRGCPTSVPCKSLYESSSPSGGARHLPPQKIHMFPTWALTLRRPNAKYASNYKPPTVYYVVACRRMSHRRPSPTVYHTIACPGLSNVPLIFNYLCLSGLRTPVYIICTPKYIKQCRMDHEGESADSEACTSVCQPVLSAFANHPDQSKRALRIAW